MVFIECDGGFTATFDVNANYVGEDGRWWFEVVGGPVPYNVSFQYVSRVPNAPAMSPSIYGGFQLIGYVAPGGAPLGNPLTFWKTGGMASGALQPGSYWMAVSINEGFSQQAGGSSQSSLSATFSLMLGSPPDGGVPDFAVSPDLAAPPDLAVPPDAAVPGDLSFPDDGWFLCYPDAGDALFGCPPAG